MVGRRNMKTDYNKNYYKAKEAQERLGVDKNRFNYLVRTGKIKKFVPPGHSQGLYLKTEIDKLAREMLAFMAYDEKQGLQVMKAKTDDDFNEEHELATLLFGHAVHSMETRRAWLEKNPDIDIIARDYGRLVGFINLLPAKHEAIEQFMSGKIRGWEIKADDVLPFTPGSTMECILMGMATTPDVSLTRRTQYGAKLISGLVEFLHELAQKSITITKFYATSATPTGIAILRNAGFREVNNIGNRIAFELDIMTSDSLLATEYRRVLTEMHAETKPKRQSRQQKSKVAQVQ
jgi:hypothetical protein